MGDTKGKHGEYLGYTAGAFFGGYCGNTSGIHAECVGNTMEMREDSSNGYVSVM